MFWVVPHWRVTWWKTEEHDRDKTERKTGAGSHFDNQGSCDWLTGDGWQAGPDTLFNRTFHSSHNLGEILFKAILFLRR